ncbi:MAG TPA: hypothetical protein PKE32_00580 [Miltoncostaeaceae bacterium]|nr:hypothetical protein [Miltoncostaeaceae bacterium]
MSRSLFLTLMLSAVGAGLFGAAAVQAAGATAFATPSLNIGCYGDATMVRCDIRTSVGRRPPKPKSCHADWGMAFAVTPRGRGRGLCVSDTTLPDPNRPPRILRYGATLRLNPRTTCTSRTSGLTCRNTAGHGFTLSRQQIRLF